LHACFVSGASWRSIQSHTSWIGRVQIVSNNYRGCQLIVARVHVKLLGPLCGHVVFDIHALRMLGWPSAHLTKRSGEHLPGLPALPGLSIKPEHASGRVIGALVRGFVEWRAMHNPLLPLFNQPAGAVSAGAKF